MKKILIFLGTLAAVAIAFLATALRDDTTLLVEPDIDAHAPQPGNAEHTFGLLLTLSEAEFEYRRLPRKPGAATEENHSQILSDNRQTIITNFENTQGHVIALEQLSEFDQIGDPSVAFSSAVVKFSTLSSLSNAICSYTELAFHEGLPNNGLHELLLLNSVMESWIPNTRPLVHTMIAEAVMSRVRDTARRILPNLSDDELAQLSAAFSDRVDFTEAVNRSLYSEYCMAAVTAPQFSGPRAGLYSESATLLLRDFGIPQNRSMRNPLTHATHRLILSSAVLSSAGPFI